MNLHASLQPKIRRTVTLIVAACVPLTLPAAAQEKPTPPETSAPASAPTNPANPAAFSYDVVSIKPFKMGPDSPMMFNSTADGLLYRGTDLMSLLMNAFPTQRPDQLSGLPDWANPSAMSDERWTFEAKMDENTAVAFKKLPLDRQREIRRSMMLQVLVDRFNLKYHKETRELPVYNLVIAKNGPKFKETPEGKQDNMMMGWGEISGDGIEFDSGLLMNLSNDSRRFVIDKTGLTGKYSFSLKWDPFAENNLPASFTDQYPQFKGRPGIRDALEEQLGLKLEPAKGPVDVFVIDHIEKPSEN
jgi:uncharacterized protein (TIGR03435 family)